MQSWPEILNMQNLVVYFLFCCFFFIAVFPGMMLVSDPIPANPRKSQFTGGALKQKTIKEFDVLGTLQSTIYFFED